MFLEDTDIGRLIAANTSTEKTAMSKKSDFGPEESKKISDGLSKVANLPYKEGAYDSVCSMMK
ncbi:MAG: hypothetical protein HWN80_20410, partial [Candidatus Lokiarchaeota archaeon]|nr:hypothetical protein [Candidatus Lokiarchaeota archaeon]